MNSTLERIRRLDLYYTCKTCKTRMMTVCLDELVSEGINFPNLHKHVEKIRRCQYCHEMSSVLSKIECELIEDAPKKEAACYTYSVSCVCNKCGVVNVVKVTLLKDSVEEAIHIAENAMACDTEGCPGSMLVSHVCRLEDQKES